MRWLEVGLVWVENGLHHGAHLWFELDHGTEVHEARAVAVAVGRRESLLCFAFFAFCKQVKQAAVVGLEQLTRCLFDGLGF